MIGKIDHVGIAVESIEEAKKTYEALGLSVESVGRCRRRACGWR